MSMRWLSAFMFFSNDTRETVKRECPELEFLQISSEIGRRWKSLTAEQRRPYEAMEAADKMQALREEEHFYMPAYGAPPPAPTSPRRGPSNRPRELMACLTFCKETGDTVFVENPTKPMVEAAPLLADRNHVPTGSCSSPVACEPIEMSAAAASSAAATSYDDIVAADSSSPLASPGPSSPPNASTPAAHLHSGFVYFCFENQGKLGAENPRKSPSEIVELLEQCWRKLSDKERDEYRMVY